MKALLPKYFVAFLALLVLCVQISDGFTIREKRGTKEEKVPVKKSKVPLIAEDNRLALNGRVKISELKPCISKAFCEVNSITEDPTYETNKEFYLILNRLKKFIDEDEQDLNGSGSVEEDSASSEESYERVNWSGPPGPRYPDYRRGKSLDSKDKKKKKKVKKPSLLTKVNGTESGINGSSISNKTTSVKILSPSKVEKRAFVDKKTRELNVVDDLAALIKISAEIGQALKSPRRCRALFKKCQMTYDQIINIFNQTQSVETSDDTVLPTIVEVTKKPPRPSTTSSTTTTLAPQIVDDEAENVSTGEGNRNKKSRHDFSDEDIEYVTDTEIQPVKTYALFAPQEQHDNRHPEEILVEEAFKKFENTFPVSGAPDNIDFLKKGQSKKIIIERAPEGSSEEEDGSEEGYSRERTDKQYSHKYQHRASGEAENQESEEVIVEKPYGDGKLKSKYSANEQQQASIVPLVEGEEAEDDSDPEISSGEIDKKPLGDQPKRRPQADESSEEYDEGSEESGPQQVHPRDEEYTPDGYYPVRPAYSKGSSGSGRPGKEPKKKNKKKSKPQKDVSEDDQNSSEEQEMPPQGSDFYHHLKGMNDGEGADGVPGKMPYNKKGKKHGGRPGYGEKPGYEDQSTYGGQGGYGGKPSSYGSQSPYGDIQQDGMGGEQSQPSFFQSIMSWFSGGSKSGSGSEEQQSQLYGGYGQKPYGQEPQTYDDYKPYGKPSGYSSKGYDLEPSSYPYSDDGYSKPSKRRRSRPPQGRGGEESSEEVEEEEEEELKPSKKRGQHKRAENSEKSVSKRPTKSGPPPPLVIVPQDEESEIPAESVATNSKPEKQETSSSNKKKSSKPHKKGAKPELEASEEESKEVEASSEEADQAPPKKSKSPSKGKHPHEEESMGKNKQSGSVPSYEKYFTGIFGSAEDIVRQQQPSASELRRQQEEEEENKSLLVKSFDTIASSFSTSADKVTDWSEEDNPKKRINVGSLANNEKKSKGRYTVVRNRNKNKSGGQSYEVEDRERVTSSEEEEKKK